MQIKWIKISGSIKDTTLALEGIQVSFNSLARVLVDEKLPETSSCRPKRRLCLTNTPCGTWSSASDQGERSTQKREGKATWPW